MKQLPELTLVLPMYNVEQFVERCLESIYCEQPDVEQERIEVVLVDDGSPDRSAAVAEAWLTAHGARNHRIIHQENRGLGGARNTGLRAARAPYVWFIDTDDRLAPRSLAPLLSRLTAGDDIITFHAATISNPDECEAEPCQVYAGLPEVMKGTDLLCTFQFRHNVQFNCYRVQFLKEHGLEFKEHLYHEDTEFTPRAYYFAEKMRILQDVQYISLVNPNSITQTVNFKKNFDLVRVAQSLSDFINTHPASAQLYAIFSRIIATSVNGAFLNFDVMPRDVYEQLTHNLYDHRRLYQHFLKSSLLKHNIQGAIYNLCPKYAPWIYSKCLKKLARS